MSTAFKNPPINEVALATYFNPPLAGLRSEHVGLLWDRIRYDFPTVQQQPPLPSPSGNVMTVGGGDFPPVPRFWFIGRNDTYVIQIQKDMFIFNWRRRGSALYPGFDGSIKPAFDKYYNIFEEFTQKELDQPSLPIGICELTYITSIDPCDMWVSLKDTPKVIPSFSIPNPGLDANPLFFNCAYAYEVAESTTLRVVLQGVPRPDPSGTPMLSLEIKVIGTPEEETKAAADEWFQASHDRINRCFLGITSPEMQQRYWQPVKEAK